MPGHYVVAVGALHLYGEEICRRCFGKKMANISIGPSGNFIIIMIPMLKSIGVVRLSLKVIILPILLRKMVLFLDRHQAYALSRILSGPENCYDTRR